MRLDPSIILAGENVSHQIAAAQQPRMNAMRMQALQQDMGASQQAQKEANAVKLARMVLGSQNPAEAYPRALQAAQAMGIDTDGLPPSWTPQVGEQLQMFASLLEMPQDQRTEFERLLSSLPPEEQAQAIRVKAGLEPGADAMLRGQTGDRVPSSVQEYEYARQQGYDGSFRDWQADKRGPGTSLHVDPNTNEIMFTQGNVPGQRQPLGRAETNTQQKELAGEINLLGRLTKIGEDFGIKPDGSMDEDTAYLLTYKGQADNYFTKIAEKAGVEPGEARKDALRRKAKFTTSVEQLFNAYRQQITGAAAAVAELDRLKKSFLNTDMSPTEFSAAYQQYVDELKRSMRVRQRLLREGIDVGTKQGGDMMDMLFLSGEDDDPKARALELKQEGMTPEQARAKLASEGYI